MYLLDNDLNAIQGLLIANKEVLSLLDLTTNSPGVEIAGRITKKSKWDDLAGNVKRICIYPLPSRPTRSEILFEEMIEIDVHVSSVQDFKARQILGKVIDTLNSKPINGRYLTSKGVLGELPTAQGFYCVGARFGYFSPI